MATGSRTVRPRSSVWLSERKTTKRKGDQQPVGLDHLKIVAATMRLLDAEGLSGFSMRRLAAELGVTAMSVYWYVETKDHLLELALDAAMGEIALPIEAVGPDEGHEHTPAEPRDWRDQLRQMATEYRRVLVRHPWLPALLGEYLNIGPNAVGFSKAALAVMRNSGVPEDRVTSALSLVYQFVYGFGTIEGRFAARCRAEGVTQDELFHEMMSSVEDRSDFDEQRKIMEARGGNTVQEMHDRDFAFALDLAIAGIETLLD
ncbi:TetR/AcrR family transcriptional regulator C-terminal domain-containing protein [Streptomyces sp. PRKS01-29]|nr:TetR/AcrR family transcriptional regulator [Streptomyces sabulosicollis]MBI0297132.1 TetR/AcrR family transcriptional regulator C-terminal domain-containing protein [Streptomyces sabulosicollis]